MKIDGMGPLDLASVVTHVATELDRAAPATLSVKELASGYTHVIVADLSRVKRFVNLDSNAQATSWMIQTVLDELTRRKKVTWTDDRVMSANGPLLGSLRWDRRTVYPRAPDSHTQLRDPFSPLSGEFSKDIRRPGKDNLDELRESMREFGWLRAFPAIADERGTVLVGHRRLEVFKELEVEGVMVPDEDRGGLKPLEPRIVTIPFGDGDEADARRFRLALASNIGSKPLTPEDRKGIAEYLYGEREWTMARIARALNVSEMTVSNDLASSSSETTLELELPRKGLAAAKHPELRADVREYVRAGKRVPYKELCVKHGVTRGTIFNEVTEAKRWLAEQRASELEQIRAKPAAPVIWPKPAAPVVTELVAGPEAVEPVFEVIESLASEEPEVVAEPFTRHCPTCTCGH